MSWLDRFFVAKNYGSLQISGQAMPPEPLLNVIGTVASDDPSAQRTNIMGGTVYQQADGTALTKRAYVRVVSTAQVLTDTAAATVLDLTRLLGNRQQTATIADSSTHTPGSGIELAADCFTTIDAEVFAKNSDSSNWAWWRLTIAFLRVGTGAPSAVVSVVSPAGWPVGSDTGDPPTDWEVDIVTGSGERANTAFVQLQFPGSETVLAYWYIDGSRYPGDEIAMGTTITAIYPDNGPIEGGKREPAVISISPNFGPTTGG